MKKAHIQIGGGANYDDVPHSTIEFGDIKTLRNTLQGVANLIQKEIRITFPIGESDTRLPHNMDGVYLNPTNLKSSTV